MQKFIDLYRNDFLKITKKTREKLRARFENISEDYKKFQNERKLLSSNYSSKKATANVQNAQLCTFFHRWFVIIGKIFLFFVIRNTTSNCHIYICITTNLFSLQKVCSRFLEKWCKTMCNTLCASQKWVFHTVWIIRYDSYLKIKPSRMKSDCGWQT